VLFSDALNIKAVPSSDNHWNSSTENGLTNRFVREKILYRRFARDGGYYVFHIYEDYKIRNVPVSLNYIRDVEEFLATKIMRGGRSFEIPKEAPRKRNRDKG
jgi:hypothetical protein